MAKNKKTVLFFQIQIIIKKNKVPLVQNESYIIQVLIKKYHYFFHYGKINLKRIHLYLKLKNQRIVNVFVIVRKMVFVYVVVNLREIQRKGIEVFMRNVVCFDIFNK